MRLEGLYREVIMEHYKNPFNKGLLDDQRYHKVNLLNPSCGDDVTIQVLVEDETIKDVRHDGHGCSICCSSASIMANTLIGKSVKDAENIIKEYLIMLTGEDFNREILKGEPLAYQGVSQFPARVRCASIAWKAMEEAMMEAQHEK